MTMLAGVLPDPDQVLALSHAELALHILKAFAKDSHYRDMLKERNPKHIHRQNVTSEGYPEPRRAEIDLAVSEAWAWMEREILLLPAEYYQFNGHRILSRLGREFIKQGDPQTLHAARRIDRDALHAALREDALANFYRGAYDVAVFLAFREVEIAVAAASGLQDTGVILIGKAFSAGCPLRDPHGLVGEEDAVRNLFSGALGYFRNATGHRDVDITPHACADLLGLATQLLLIVDSRADRRKNGWPAP